jgi:diacylglycerol kinase
MSSTSNRGGFWRGFGYAARGVWLCLRRERNFRFHLAVTAYVLAFAPSFSLSPVEWAVLCLTFGSVLCAELVNSAVERTVDRISEENAELFDYFIVPHSHTHMGVVVPKDRIATLELHAKYLMDSFMELLDHPMIGKATAIAHPFVPGTAFAIYDATQALIPDPYFYEAFAAAREKGVAFLYGAACGGGIAYLANLKLAGDEATGADIVRRAIEEPLRQISANAGIEGSIVVMKVKEGKGFEGFNAANGTYCDLMEAGILDPKKVTRCALQNASSVAGLLLTTECMITDIPEKKSEAPAPNPGMGGMGGMM